MIKSRVQKIIDEARGGVLSGDVITRMAYQSLKGVSPR